MAIKHQKLLIKDAFFSTVFVMICIGVFAFNPFNFHLFNVIGEGFKDIEISDILFSKKNETLTDIEAKISKEIVLVNSADRDRAGIARLINKINTEKPAVLGVDFIFEGPKNAFGDSLLKSALSQCKNIVLASKFKDGDHGSYISPYKELGTYSEGYANLMINSLHQTVRYFRTSDQRDEIKYFPFAIEVASMYNPAKIKKYTARNQDFEIINYQGNLNSIYHFNGNDIESDQFPKGFLKDKIVLLGFFGSDCNSNIILDDNFYTPLNEKIIGKKTPDAYGIVIQANIIQMVLNENYINKCPVWLEFLLGFGVCFLHNLIFIWLYLHRHMWYHFFAKMIQLITSILMVLLCIYLFKSFNIKLNATPIIVPILLTVDLLYFYDTLVLWLHKHFKTKTYLNTGPLHH